VSAKRGLTAKQQLFVDEYMIDLNATQAAPSIVCDNLKKPEIAAALALAYAARREKAGVTADRVLAELSKSAFRDVRKMFGPDGRLKLPTEWDDDIAGAIASIESETVIGDAGGGEARLLTRVTKIKLSDKLRALDQLARHLALYNDGVQCTKHSPSISYC
jgi:phage terminase small subunit